MRPKRDWQDYRSSICVFVFFSSNDTKFICSVLTEGLRMSIQRMKSSICRAQTPETWCWHIISTGNTNFPESTSISRKEKSRSVTFKLQRLFIMIQALYKAAGDSGFNNTRSANAGNKENHQLEPCNSCSSSSSTYTRSQRIANLPE